jgi:hypothetical protein
VVDHWLHEATVWKAAMVSLPMRIEAGQRRWKPIIFLCAAGLAPSKSARAWPLRPICNKGGKEKNKVRRRTPLAVVA